ncbi:MAG: hypothetical protein P0Y63_01615 [Klebsiella huaxiensis]|uniref:hypothetical protein n=1 Tax=Klebsiella huaxiensis TaxID=2153354 RepID=UPI0026EC774A|nr:hypothetical protein [Klebsiella huaxiensis]WEJ89765.1 MAG: hypothetical protein P0Y63_01615 [Klebsiella huaxiensis]
MQKWSQPLIWGMVIAVIGPIIASYFGLVLIYFGSLTMAGIAVLLWVLYFYAIYLLCTRPHDDRFVQIYMLIMSIIMLPWGLVLVFTFFASATKAHNQRVLSDTDETKDG